MSSFGNPTICINGSCHVCKISEHIPLRLRGDKHLIMPVSQAGCDNLYMSANGHIYRIAAEHMLHDMQVPMHVPYSTFMGMSSCDYNIGMDMMLNCCAHEMGFQYSSRNISIISIPDIGIAWATRIKTTVPIDVSTRLGLECDTIGSDFLFLWPPGKALAAYIAICEQTRIDNKNRTLCFFDPTPRVLFTDWNDVVVRTQRGVDASDLSMEQRIFAASLKPMLHLASPRFSKDTYCEDRVNYDIFECQNAPIQVKYGKLKMRHTEGAMAMPGTAKRQKWVPNNNVDRLSNACTAEADTYRGITWDVDVSSDIQEIIVCTVLNNVMKMSCVSESINTIKNVRLVSTSFRSNVDKHIHECLTASHTWAAYYSRSVRNNTKDLETVLLQRKWWAGVRLPYIDLLTYTNDNPRRAVSKLMAMLHEKKNYPLFPVSSVHPTLHSLESRESFTMCQLKYHCDILTSMNSRIRV